MPTAEHQTITVPDPLPRDLAGAGFWLIFGGISLLIVGFAYSLYTWFWTKDAQPTTGIVVEMVEVPESSAQSPRLRYLVNDHVYVYDGFTFVDFGNYHVGQELPMIYDPAQPTPAKVKTFPEIWLGPILLISGGFIMILFELPFLYRWWNQRAKQPIAKP